MSDKYAFQAAAVDEAVAFLASNQIASSMMLVSPTGSGKSFMEGWLHKRASGRGRVHYTIAPTIEILSGIYRKFEPDNLDTPTREQMESAGFWTVKTLLNRARAGDVVVPNSLTFDEGHHSVDPTHTELWAIFGCPPRVSFTATDYRGTPQETRKLREAYPIVRHVLSLQDAVTNRVIAAPTFTVWPLMNDDLIRVVNGEFVVSEVNSQFKTALPDLVARIGRFFNPSADVWEWDRPTMLSVNSVAQANDVKGAFDYAGLPTELVTGDTPAGERASIFAATVARKQLLIQISVVGEGIDLPLRRLIDCAPTVSPVRFQQRLGRITRPTEEAPEYIACCHNLTRHAYLWHGIIPRSELIDAQKAWGPDYKPPRRSLARALGLEGFGKFTVSPVPLADGLTASVYSLATKDGLEQYAVVLHPMLPEPVYARRTNAHTGETAVFEAPGGKLVEYKVKSYGRWKLVDGFPDMEGVASTKLSPPTPNMLKWWKRDARRFGLDDQATPDARTFQVLPILSDTRPNWWPRG